MNKLTKGILGYFVVSNLIMGVLISGLVIVGGTAYMINTNNAEIEQVR